MIRHYFDFISSGHGLKEIDEPDGFRDCPFVIEQQSGRKGRDLYYGDKAKITIYKRLNQCYDIFEYNRRKYGSEAKIKYKISFTEGEYFTVGQVVNVTTNGSSYFSFQIMEESERMTLKRRYDVNTNLFSYTTLDEAPIDPVQTKNVLIKAKPVLQVSEWEWKDVQFQEEWAGYGQDFAFIAPFPYLTKYDIGTSLAPASVFFTTESNPSEGELQQIRQETTVVRAITNLSKMKIKLDGINLFVGTIGNNVTTRIGVSYGTDYQSGQYTTEYLYENPYDVDLNDVSYELDIPFLNNTGFIFVQISISQPYSTPGGTPVSTSTIRFSASKMTITATEIAYNTIAPMVRLIDAMRYNVKSASNLPISAPRWDFGGELYDQWITTQALMRNLTDKPFNISFKDIVEEYLPEVNGDYQLQEDGTVFIGAADEYTDDFYRDYQMEDYTLEELELQFGQPGQIDEFEIKDNENLAINEFKFGYKNYSSQKENEQANTYDLVHGETEWLLYNDLSENTKEVQVGWIRDAFLIEESRRKAIDLSDTTATQDDDKIYIMDIVPLDAADRFFTETAALQHRASTNKLVLKNQETFSWVLLGIITGSTFEISNGANQGVYFVIAVTDTELTLLATDAVDIDDLNTTFTYFIMPGVADLTIRTDEGFDIIENIQDGNNFANLRFTSKRNIIKRYSKYLAACTMFAENKNIKNTLYKNNPDAFTKLLEESTGITEGETFTSVSPILAQDLITVQVLMSLEQFFNLRSLVRSECGYITTFYPDKLPLKGYIQKASWTAQEDAPENATKIIGITEFTLEEKYQRFYMYIFGTGGGAITINGTLQATDFDFTIDEYEKLSIFDQNGKRMFVPVPYNRVKVNNSDQASSVFEMTQWLQTLQS